MAHDVFISYSSKDKPTADAVCARLEAQGIRCWIAPRDVLPGEPYGESIIKAIHESRLLVLVFSGHSNSSPQVMREVERAVSTGIPILPFRIEDVPLSPSMEYFISAPHWLDAITGPLEEHLERLVATATVILDKSTPGAHREPIATAARPGGPPSPSAAHPVRKTPSPLVLAGVALLVLVLGGMWALLSGRARGAGERSSAGVTAVARPEPSLPPAGQEPERPVTGGAGQAPSAEPALPRSPADRAATGDTAASERTASHSAGSLRGTVGEALSDGRWRLQVLDIRPVQTYRMQRTTDTDYALYHASAELNNATFSPKPGNTLLIADCRVTNTSKEKQSLWHADTSTAVLSDQGESFPPIAFDMRGDITQSEPLSPGSKLDCGVLFAVPQNTKPKELVFTLKTVNDKQGTDVHVSL